MTMFTKESLEQLNKNLQNVQNLVNALSLNDSIEPVNKMNRENLAYYTENLDPELNAKLWKVIGDTPIHVDGVYPIDNDANGSDVHELVITCGVALHLNIKFINSHDLGGWSICEVELGEESHILGDPLPKNFIDIAENIATNTVFGNSNGMAETIIEKTLTDDQYKQLVLIEALFNK